MIKFIYIMYYKRIKQCAALFLIILFSHNLLPYNQNTLAYKYEEEKQYSPKKKDLDILEGNAAKGIREKKPYSIFQNIGNKIKYAFLDFSANMYDTMGENKAVIESWIEIYPKRVVAVLAGSFILIGAEIGAYYYLKNKKKESDTKHAIMSKINSANPDEYYELIQYKTNNPIE